MCERLCADNFSNDYLQVNDMSSERRMTTVLLILDGPSYDMDLDIV